MDVDIGARIRKCRKLNGLSQADLASILDVTQTDISKLENNKTNIKLSTAMRIADALGADASEIYPVVRHTAEWIGDSQGIYRCSHCGYVRGHKQDLHRYCEACGAEMGRRPSCEE